MAIIYRNVTGPIRDGSGTLLASGTIKAKLQAPQVDGDTFVITREMQATITGGAFTLALGAPGTYTFTIQDGAGNTIDVFSKELSDSSSDDISLAALYSTT